MVCGVLLGVAYHANAMGMRSWKASLFTMQVSNRAPTNPQSHQLKFSILGDREETSVLQTSILESEKSDIVIFAARLLRGQLFQRWQCVLQIPGPVSAGFGRVLGPLLQDRQSQRTLVRPVQTDSRSPTMGSLQRPMGQRSRPAAAVTASREAVEQLVAMGFSEVDARSALERSNNDVQAATSLLL